MRLNFKTSVFGRIEMHTTVHDNRVGLSLSSERGDLRGALGADTAQLDATLGRHDLRLHELRFLEHGADLTNSGGGPDRGSHGHGSQDRSSQNRASHDRAGQEHPRLAAEGRGTAAASLVGAENTGAANIGNWDYGKGGLSLHV